jgi:hypothetical protein
MVLNLRLDVIDGIRRFDFECDEGESRKECALLELLASEDEMLLIRMSMLSWS